MAKVSHALNHSATAADIKNSFIIDMYLCTGVVVSLDGQCHSGMMMPCNVQYIRQSFTVAVVGARTKYTRTVQRSAAVNPPLPGEGDEF